MIKPATKLEENTLSIYQHLLRNKKAELQAALEINIHRLTEEDERTGPDPEQILQEESVKVRLNQVLFRQLRQVQEALDRLEAGDYGNCLACGDPIVPKRLLAVPWTRYCLSCQEKESSMPSAELTGGAERMAHGPRSKIASDSL